MAPKAKKEKKQKPKSESKNKTKKKGEPGRISRVVTWFWSLFEREPGTPVKGTDVRLINITVCHFRGILGVLVPICFLCFLVTMKGSLTPSLRCTLIWMLMFWFFLLQPVAIPVTSFIPIFLFPMTGIISSSDVCQCYINEGILLFILTSMLLLCFNNSGFDRRLALWFIASGDLCQFGSKRLLFKCCTAAFFMSMLSNRLIAASTIIQYITKPLMDLQAGTSRATEPCYDTIRNIMVSATSISCAIGSIAIIHAAPATLAFRTIFHESATYPDIFNYLQYSAYAFPTAAVLNLANIGYHTFLIAWETNKPMSLASMKQLRAAILNYKKLMPKIMRRHEVLSVFFVMFYLSVFFTRWCKWLNMGWADYSKYIYGGSEDVPGCMDATTAAIFVIALHTFPKGFSFWHVLCEHKKSRLPPLKMESSILWWRFVDKNINYAYMFLIGCGVAITKAADVHGLNDLIAEQTGKLITYFSFKNGLLVICLISVTLANIMPGVAGLVMFLPFVIGACKPKTVALDEDSKPEPVNEFSQSFYLCALAVGIGSSFGFMCPFLYTPAYFCHNTGKVPRKKMAKYGFVAAVLSCFVLWFSLRTWAPYVWDPTNSGIFSVDTPADAVGATTAKPEGVSSDSPASVDNPP